MAEHETSTELRAHLVDTLERRGSLRTAGVRDAFLQVPRELFIPDVAAKDGLDVVYRNQAHPAKVDTAGRWLSSSSEPQVMATMLEALDLHAGHRVLEIGAGTGYNAALMASIVGVEGRVTTVDIAPDLVQRAAGAAGTAGLKIHAVTGDGRAGWGEGAPYDRIIVTASSPAIERAWLEQLRDGGLLVVPLDEFLPPIGAIPGLRRVDNRLEMVGLVRGGFMPLRSEADVFPHHGAPPSAGAFDSFDGHRPLVWLSGLGIAHLGAPSRRRLLSMILGNPRPRRTRISIVGGSWWAPDSIVPPDLFLGIAVPGDRVVQLVREGVAGVGVVSSDGRSLAAVCRPRPTQPRTGPDDEPPDDAVWSENYGSGQATAVLDRILREWRNLGPPTFSNLAMRVDLGAAPSQRSWRRWRRGDCWFSFDWRKPGASRLPT